jgi:hypothetical protein
MNSWSPKGIAHELLQNDSRSSFVERGRPLNSAHVKNSFQKQKIIIDELL